jgi:hypothetical protein
MLLTADVERAVSSARAKRAELAQLRQELAKMRLASDWQRARARRALRTVEHNLLALRGTIAELPESRGLEWRPASDLLDDVLFPVD